MKRRPTPPSLSADRLCKPVKSNDESLPDGAPSALAKTLLDMARKLDATEDAIRREVLVALQQGDTARATKLLEKWIEGPVAEVLADGDSSSDDGRHDGRGKRLRRHAKRAKDSADANA
jgi:hypothetical protein